jgi:hypothetical protein
MATGDDEGMAAASRPTKSPRSAEYCTELNLPRQYMCSGCILYVDASLSSRKKGPRAVTHTGGKYACRQPWKKDATKEGAYDLKIGRGNSWYQNIHAYLNNEAQQGVNAQQDVSVDNRLETVMEVPQQKQIPQTGSNDTNGKDAIETKSKPAAKQTNPSPPLSSSTKPESNDDGKDKVASPLSLSTSVSYDNPRYDHDTHAICQWSLPSTRESNDAAEEDTVAKDTMATEGKTEDRTVVKQRHEIELYNETNITSTGREFEIKGIPITHVVVDTTELERLENCHQLMNLWRSVFPDEVRAAEARAAEAQEDEAQEDEVRLRYGPILDLMS